MQELSCPHVLEHPMGYNIAIVGATGNVGRELLEILADREFPVNEVFAIASRRSLGTEVSFGDKTLKCEDLEQFDFSRADIVLMSAGGTLSKEWAPKIAAKGCVVIDNSSAWRYDADVPLIVPEVNADAVSGFAKKNIIANPNCSTAQLVVALKPLHDAKQRSSASSCRPINRFPAPARPPWKSCGTRPRGSSSPIRRHAGDVHQTDRLQRHPAHRRVHGGRPHEGRVEDGGRDQEDTRPQASSSRPPACGCRCSSATGEAVNIEFEEADHRR